MKAKTETVTGTDSSSKMAVCVTQATKAGFSTESGPWGGDAQLAGLITHKIIGEGLLCLPTGLQRGGVFAAAQDRIARGRERFNVVSKAAGLLGSSTRVCLRVEE